MFTNRNKAGEKLAKRLRDEFSFQEEAVVLSIPKGGVVVGVEVAKVLSCPHDIICVKKVTLEKDTELALGAVGETEGSVYLNKRILEEERVDKREVELIVAQIKQRIKEEEKEYRQHQSEIDLKGKQVIVVDDGAATGATMIAAVREVWNRSPRKVVVALPVCPLETLKLLETEVDAVIVLEVPTLFSSVGEFYEDFQPVKSSHVKTLLSSAL